jgi:hypothetical protein
MMRSEMEYYQEENYEGSSKAGKSLEKFIHPTGNIIGGCIMMIIGVYLYFLNYLPLVEGIDPQFLLVVNYFGIFTVAQGSLVFARGLIGNKLITLHQTIMVVQILLSIASITLLITLYNSPEIIPFLIYNEHSGTFVNIGVPIALSYVRLIIIGIAALVVIGALSDMFKAGKLSKYK